MVQPTERWVARALRADWDQTPRRRRATGVCVYCFTHMVNRPVDHVDGACGTSGVHALAAGDTDDFDSPTCQNGHEHSINGASGSPHYGVPSLERPDAREPTGG